METDVQVSKTEKEILSESLCYYFWDMNSRSAETRFKYFPMETSRLIIGLAAVTCMVGILTNSVVIYIAGFKMKEQKSRLWYLNLALADMFFLLTTPMRVYIALERNWTFGPHLCKLSYFAFVCNMYSSAFLITALSIDRVLSVAKPIWHHRIFTQRICFCVCTVIWVLVLPLAAPAIYFIDEHKLGNQTECAFVPFIYQTTSNYSIGRKVFYKSFAFNALQMSRQINSTWEPPGFFKFPDHRQGCKDNMCCADDTSLELYQKKKNFHYIFYIPILAIGYFIPLCVMLFSNLITILQVRKSQHLNSNKLYRLVALLVGVFVLTKTPIAAATIAYVEGVRQMNVLYMVWINGIKIILFVVGNLCSCLNPILYVLVGSKAREVIVNSMSSLKCAISQKSNQSQ